MKLAVAFAAGVSMAIAVPAAPAPPMRSPSVNYALHCQGCHLPDGSGMHGKVPDMRNFLGRLVQIPGGRAYIVQVPGSANSTLNDAETASLLTWLVRKMGPSVPDFRPYTAEEVGPLRRRWLRQPGLVRAGLEKALPMQASPAEPARPQTTNQ